MIPKRFWIDLVLILLLTVVIIFIAREWGSSTPQESSSIFSPPQVLDSKEDGNTHFKISFSNYSNVQDIQFRIEVTTETGTIDLGSFEVRDVRIWNLDGSRIINNEFEVSSRPMSIRVYINNEQEVLLYDQEIASDTETIIPVNDSIASNLIYEIIK